MGVCGGEARGLCVNITNTVQDPCLDGNNNDTVYCRAQAFMRSRPGTNRTDFRYLWPTQIFQSICVCNDNYGGYNCMSCKRGFTGDDCSQTADPVVRRNILSLTIDERQKLLEILQMIKSTKASGYAVPIREPVTNVSSESFAEISLYDIFVSFHFNAIRDQEINKCDGSSIISNFCNQENPCPVPDFGHEGPTFLTWHRAYMLYVETEIQRVTRDPTFGLPYWDWTDESQRDDIWDIMGKSDCGIFGNDPNKTQAPIDGPFKNWDAICTDALGIICNADNQVCNPEQGFTNIQRCIGGTAGVQCRVEMTLPSTREVDEALKQQDYDNEPYGKEEDNNGFRNALEGFEFLVDRNRSICENFPGGFRITELHNRVHIYIGGNMLDVPQASNDPVFFFHHCNIDRIYEEWLNQSTVIPPYQPSTFNYGINPGNNKDEYLVPIFPLFTNQEMHVRATALGYTYATSTKGDDSGSMAIHSNIQMVSCF